MFVRTERLFLRPGWPEDLEDLLDALEDEEVQRNVVLTATLPRSACDLREYLERPRDPLLPHFFIYLRSANGPTLVGSIGFGRHDDGEVEIGYWIAPRYRGRGYAAEAVRAVLRQASSLGHRRIYANHFADNGITVQVLESAGFQDTGQVRLRYSPLRGGEAKARVYVAELERRTSPRIEAALSA